MAHGDRVALLIDGEFLKKTLAKKLRHFPKLQDVQAEIQRILTLPDVAGLDLYRIFYYTADPVSGVATHPLSKAKTDFATSPAFARNTQLIDLLENQPDVAVRRGTLVHQGWEIEKKAAKALTIGSKKQVDPQDIVPKIQQKGVDMRLGLDIASLALKRLVSVIVIVSGDSDLVPAMKLARREGLRVFLDTAGSKQVRRELKIHADRVL